EYAVGAATVANGWSGYFQSVLLKLGIVVPMALTGAPHKYDQGHFLPNLVAEYEGAKVTEQVIKGDKPSQWADGSTKTAEVVFWVFKEKKDDKTIVVGKVGDPAVEAKIENTQQAVINLPAILVVCLVTVVLVKGISESAGFNALMVGIKVAAVLFVIG